MSESYSVTTDADINAVVEVLRASGLFEQEFYDQEFTCFRFTTANNSFLTAAEDLKIFVDEMETWLDTDEWGDPHLQYRLFNLLKEKLTARVTRDSRDAVDPGEEHIPEPVQRDQPQKTPVIQKN